MPDWLGTDKDRHLFMFYTCSCSIKWETKMSTNVNFTASVDRDLLKRAKEVAAKTETSVNALFNSEFRYLVETFEEQRSRTIGISEPCCTFPSGASMI